MAYSFVFRIKTAWRLAGVCSCLIMGYVFLLNDRRAALVGLGLSGASLLLAMPKSLWRKIWPHAALGTLGLATFLALTWNAAGTVGFAARTIKSLSDPNESSAGYRRIENANLLSAVEHQPLTGIGFGRRFDLVYPMPDISGIYSEFDLIPHNTLLFIWTFAGPLGMAAFATFMSISIGVALRTMRAGQDIERSVLAALSAIVIIKGLAYVFADLGLREVRLLSFVGLIGGANFRGFEQSALIRLQKHKDCHGGTSL